METKIKREENPYDPKVPVTEINQFFGRKEIIDQILTGIDNEKSFAVIGGRKIGKTSLLNLLAQKIHKKSSDDTILIPLVMDLQKITPKSRISFFKFILNESVDFLNKIYHVKLEESKFTLQKINNEEEFHLDSILNPFQKLKETCLNYWGDAKILCLIDELEYLNGKAFTEDLLSNLRVIISNHPIQTFISFVVFGNRFLHEMSDMKGSPLENVLITLQLGAFSENEAIELIYSNMPSDFERELAKIICKESGLHPFIIKFIMSEIWERQKRKKIDLNDVYDSCRLVRSSRVFHHWYSELNDLDKRLYFEFAKLASSEYVKYSTAGLVKILKSDFIEDSLDKLFYHGLIHREEADTFYCIPSLFANYFKINFAKGGTTFNIDLDIYQSMLEAVKEDYDSNEKQKKGKSLELLAKYLIESCDGLNVKMNQQTRFGEIDLIISNKSSSHSFLSNFGDFFICECKNWSKKVGIQPIQSFRLRMENFETKLGLYFSKNGVTGSASSAAKNQIYDLYTKQKYYLIVITLSDLEKISKGEDFIAILEDKSRHIRFQIL